MINERPTMTTLAWCTDIHLDFLDSNYDKFLQFCDSFSIPGLDGILITGDIAIADSVCAYLKSLENNVNVPIYFVLGNHDFYGGSFESVRKDIAKTVDENLVYLSTSSFISLNESTALIGHDGWYDAGNGKPEESNTIMSDWIKIDDFAKHEIVFVSAEMYSPCSRLIANQQKVMNLIKDIAFVGVEHVSSEIDKAVNDHETIVVATHVPPFVDCLSGRRFQDVPWYTSKMMGDMLLHMSEKYPNNKFEVYSGHIHQDFRGKIAENLTCYNSLAKYGHPQIQRLIEL